ncbi:MAG: tyrosine-type recombinase/integrase [Candidatus Micrarchaeota archaeon]|nr:tyrosine-type recombinase/integrase [Candidatus Micrarchaeota archaeon]
MEGTFPSGLQPTIRKFVELKSRQASPIRLVKILSHLRVFYKFTKGRDDNADKFFKHLEKEGRSPETLNDFRAILGAYFRWRHGIKDQGLPPELDFLAGRRFKSVKKLGPTWSPEDVRAWVDAALTLQDKALATSLGLGGFRMGEVLPMLRKNIETVNKERGEFRFYVDGKTGPGELLVIDRWGFIGQYLQQFKGGPDDYLFPGLRGQKAPTYFAAKKRLRMAAQRAGIDKKLNPHWLRHSRATLMAEHGATEAQMCAAFRWAPGSKMPARYLHLSGRSADKFIRAESDGSVDELVRSKFGELETAAGRQRARLFKEIRDQFMREEAPAMLEEFRAEMERIYQLDRNLTSTPDAIGRI